MSQLPVEMARARLHKEADIGESVLCLAVALEVIYWAQPLAVHPTLL